MFGTVKLSESRPTVPVFIFARPWCILLGISQQGSASTSEGRIRAMKCVHCGIEAVAICRWCGRAVCGDHIKAMTYIISVYVGGKKVPKSLVVADAVWCGTCKPQPEPIEMPYLD